MSNPGDFAHTLKQQADIVRIIGDYVKLKKTGGQNFVGLCPFHDEKSASFSVHATRQFYHCFGCGASGDVFTFVQKIEDVSFPEAVRTVAQKLGVALPKQTYSSPAEAKEAQQRGAILDLHEQACTWFQEQLRRPESAKAREYLISRGLNEEAIKTFRIGYAPDSGFLLRDRLKGSFSEEILRASGLFSWKTESESPAPQEPAKPAPSAIYAKFRGRILFPICNEQGRVLAFTGRALETGDKAGPKYLNSPETPIYSKGRVLFNLHLAKEAIRKLEYAILVEGQMDCLSVYMAGFHNVIAISGTAFSEMQVRLLGRFTRNVVVSLDPDAAGAAATERSLGMLVEEEFQIKVLSLEPGFDPDLFIRSKGAQAYAAALKNSPRYFDFLIDRARTMFPPRTPEGKAKALNYLLPHIQQIHSRIVRDELAADIAQKLGIDSMVLRQELRHAVNARSAVKITSKRQISEAEKILIRVLADQGTGLRDRAAELLETEALHRDLSTEVILEALRNAKGVDAMQLDLSDVDRQLLADVLLSEEAAEVNEELLLETMEVLRRGRLERRQREIRAGISEAERRNDTSRLAELLQEKIRIDRALSQPDRHGL